VEFQLGKWREAISSYTTMLRNDPTNYEGWFDYGEVLFDSGFYQESLKAFNKCISLAPTWAEPY
jgi:tetratricopeptide (TPR) repeat protein